MKTEFKLGPLQEKWLQELEQHPERQLKGVLGRKDKDGSYKCCCLGQALLVCGRGEWDKLGRLVDEGYAGHLYDTYHVLGLRSESGRLKYPIPGDEECRMSLASLNDSGMTWPQIAAEIRKDPTNFFTESK